jgi:rSAM/selenodomain-associated transferase 2
MTSKQRDQISVIIPVLNEQEYMHHIFKHITQQKSKDGLLEIVVVDGGSTDQTVAVAKEYGAKVVQGQKGRAKQMNLGARVASGGILYFLHVDTLPPTHFDTSILTAIQEGHKAGCFQMRFDQDSNFLKFFGWCTRINLRVCRGGDQSLFISRSFFEELDGFNESYVIYEDNEFIGRIYRRTPFKILPDRVITSARRYREKGMVRLQFHFAMIHIKHFLGAPPEELHAYYRKHCSHP